MPPPPRPPPPRRRPGSACRQIYRETDSPGIWAGSDSMEQHWSLPATPAAVGQLRHAVAAFALASGVDDPPLANIRLAVSEAVTNVVIHGYRVEAGPGSVDVHAQVNGEQMSVSVTDDG